MHPPIGRHQVFLTNQARDRSKIRRIKADREGGIEKRYGVYPPYREESHNRSERDRGNHECSGQICHHHQAFAIHAINPGANDQSKEEIRKDGDCNCQAPAGP